VNSEGTDDGTLLKLLSRCMTPSGQPLYNHGIGFGFSYFSSQGSAYSASGYACLYARFLILTRGIFVLRILYIYSWSSSRRLDAVQDLIDHPTFESDFCEIVKGLPDLERIVSRIHAKNCRIKDFIKVLSVWRSRTFSVTFSNATSFIMNRPLKS
jgi:DNA mismatch repair protein MSH6